MKLTAECKVYAYSLRNYNNQIIFKIRAAWLNNILLYYTNKIP